MKILRVRRGFTTNSSSASEWVPPPPPASMPPIGQTVSGIPVQEPAPPPTASNAQKVGGLAALVALAFAAERIYRKFRRKPSRGAS